MNSKNSDSNHAGNSYLQVLASIQLSSRHYIIVSPLSPFYSFPHIFIQVATGTGFGVIPTMQIRISLTTRHHSLWAVEPSKNSKGATRARGAKRQLSVCFQELLKPICLQTPSSSVNPRMGELQILKSIDEFKSRPCTQETQEVAWKINYSKTMNQLTVSQHQRL